MNIDGSVSVINWPMCSQHSFTTTVSAVFYGIHVSYVAFQIYGRVGYCSQLNPLFDHLTCRQTLAMYGNILGIKEYDLGVQTEKLVKCLGMRSISNKQIRFIRYSAQPTWFNTYVVMLVFWNNVRLLLWVIYQSNIHIFRMLSWLL